jgi:hypothetical protein
MFFVDTFYTTHISNMRANFDKKPANKFVLSLKGVKNNFLSFFREANKQIVTHPNCAIVTHRDTPGTVSDRLCPQ